MTPEEIAEAVDTARREGFERGASPSVGALLAEVQAAEGAEPGTYAAGYQDGLVKAVQTLILADVAKYHEAWEQGFRSGQRSVVVGPDEVPGA